MSMQRIVGVIVLLLFGWFTIFMIQKRAEADPQWSHLVYVYGSVEAIAFAAAGFLFGREVNRQRAETAEQSATQARQEATNARVDAAKQEKAGQALAALIAQKLAAAPAKANAFTALDDTGRARTLHTVVQSDLQEINAFAQTMFPNVHL